jgi:hypothetical protein
LRLFQVWRLAIVRASHRDIAIVLFVLPVIRPWAQCVSSCEHGGGEPSNQQFNADWFDSDSAWLRRVLFA